MISFGNVPLGSVLPIHFGTYGKVNGESITLTGLAITDVEIYKGITVTQRSSDAGVVLIDTDGIDIDGTTGMHGFSIDTGDNTDAGFFVAGAFYTVHVASVTIDSQTVNFVAATFRLTAAEGVAGVPKADVSHIDALATAGNNATLNLKQLNIVNSAGSALVASSTGSNGHGIAASGNGSGEGVSATGGATGHGFEAIGGATSGDGVHASATDGDGAELIGGTAGHGLSLAGAGAGAGLQARGGSSNGNGIEAIGDAGSVSAVADGFVVKAAQNGSGLNAIGSGTGHGVKASGGTTGSGIFGEAAGSAGNGMHLTSANGVKLSSADITGTVTTDAGNSATSFETDLASAVDDFYKDVWLKLTSGALKGQVKRVTAYVGSTKIITVEGGFTSTPADGVTFDLVNE